MGDQTTLKRVSLDLGHSHIRTSPNWQKTQAPSGRKHPNLIEEDLENLAVKWLEGGKGEELWPSNGGREDVTLRWSTDDKEITPKVKGIFVASWKLWRSRNRGKATTATQTNTAMNDTNTPAVAAPPSSLSAPNTMTNYGLASSNANTTEATIVYEKGARAIQQGWVLLNEKHRVLDSIDELKKEREELELYNKGLRHMQEHILAKVEQHSRRQAAMVHESQQLSDRIVGKRLELQAMKDELVQLYEIIEEERLKRKR